MHCRPHFVLFAGYLYSQCFVVSLSPTREMQESYVGRLLAARLIKGGLCSGSSPFGTEEEPKAASVAAVVGSSKVGQTERHTEIYI